MHYIYEYNGLIYLRNNGLNDIFWDLSIIFDNLPDTYSDFFSLLLFSISLLLKLVFEVIT